MADGATRNGAGGTGGAGASVLIPTPGEPIRIVALTPRPRLPTSYATLAGDFRSLPMSAAYHEFVRGPLGTLLPDLPSMELRLDGPIDGGRSWELPVLIAVACGVTG